MMELYMPLRISFLTICAVLIVDPGTGAHGRLFAQDDLSWRERFLKEAPPAWEKYRKRMKRLQGPIKRTTINLSPNREVVDRDWCEIKQRNDCALFLAQDDFEEGGRPPRKKGIVMGINDRYGFELSRKSPAEPWVVANLDVDLSDGMKFGLAYPGPNELVLNWATCAVNLFFIPRFSWNFEDPGLTLNRVTSVARKDGQAVQVDFSYHPPTDKPRIPTVNGRILYDPQRYWVIHEYNAQSELTSAGIKVSTVVSYEYEETSDGFPLPKRVIRRFTPVNSVEQESQFEFDLKETKVSESDFTLSAFGIPEPPGMERRWQPWYLWCAIAGLVCLSLAVLLRRLGRRGSSSG